MGRNHPQDGAEPAASVGLHLLRRVVLRLVIIYGIALGINYAWEMLQMPFYEGMYFSDPQAYLKCLKASFGDANIVIAIYGVGSLVFLNWLWPFRLTAVKVSYILAAGGSIAILIELSALKAGWWSYSAVMPLLPLTKVGLIPVLQLIFLPYLSYFLSGRSRFVRPEGT